MKNVPLKPLMPSVRHLPPVHRLALMWQTDRHTHRTSTVTLVVHAHQWLIIVTCAKHTLADMVQITDTLFWNGQAIDHNMSEYVILQSSISSLEAESQRRCMLWKSTANLKWECYDSFSHLKDTGWTVHWPWCTVCIKCKLVYSPPT